MVLAAVAVAALGAWLAEGGPVPGLGAAALTAPLLAAALGGTSAVIRLQEARTNDTGAEQLEHLEAGQMLLWQSIGAGVLGVAVVGLVLGFGVTRARSAGVPVFHAYAILPWTGFSLLLLRLGWAALTILSGWKGLAPLQKPELIGQGLTLLFGSMLGLIACVVSALISLGVGALWRRRRRHA